MNSSIITSCSSYHYYHYRLFNVSSSSTSGVHIIIITVVNCSAHHHRLCQFRSSALNIRAVIITISGSIFHYHRCRSRKSPSSFDLIIELRTGPRPIVGQTRGRAWRGLECARERDGGHDTAREGGQDGRGKEASGRASGREGGRRTSGRAEGSKAKSGPGRALRAGGPARCRVGLSMPSPSSLVIEGLPSSSTPHLQVTEVRTGRSNERAEQWGPGRRSPNPRPAR